jgi:endonuclease/exonuclease/phosphatase (EEP) superfamily protein YafD
MSGYSNNTDYWVVNIVSHFLAQYAILSLLLSVLCLYRKITVIAMLAGILFICNAVLIFDHGNTVIAGEESQNTFTLYSANINKYNKDLSRLQQEIQRLNADIVLLMEVTPQQFNQLDSLVRTFSYHIEQIPIGIENMGMVFLSRFPILNPETVQLSEYGNGIIKSELIIDKKPVLFYATHFPKTTSITEFPERKKQLMWFANQVNKKPMPVIVAGDMNATPYSPLFRKLLSLSGLKDTSTGFGWQPSWPAYLPLLWIPIDHILVSPEIQVYRRDIGSFIGSDHFPVFAELTID